MILLIVIKLVDINKNKTMNTCNKCFMEYKSSYKGNKPVCQPCRKFFVKNENFTIDLNEVAKGGNGLATAKTKKMGSDAEIKFAQLCKNKYLYKLRRSTKFEEIKLHYDYVVEIKNRNKLTYSRIEVKSMKSKSRGKPVDPNVIYLEYKNVAGGPGWIYGASDYIAFEQPKCFILVSTKDLLNFAENKINEMKLVKKSGIYNTLYSRKNRNDLVGCFMLNDILRNNFNFILDKSNF